MAVTTLQVIDTAIKFAQLDASFRPQARLFYNLAMREQGRDFKWPYWRKTAPNVSFVAGQLTYALPADYSRADTVYLYQGSERGREIKIVDPTLFDQLRASGGTLTGSPRLCVINQNDGVIQFESSPGINEFQLNYFRKGAEIDLNGGDDAAACDFEDEMMLIMKINALLYEYTNDDRYDRKIQEVDKKLREAKLNVYDTDANSVINLSNSVHVPGRRPTRGGGSGGWGSDF